VITLADVLEGLIGTRPDRASLVISEATIDSRQVIPAGLFVALPGERVDGHDFIEKAFERGAQVALVQRDLSDRFTTIDLRQQNLPQGFSTPDEPFCLLVDNTLEALQKIAGFWRSQKNVHVIGVTGSVGKSTTKELIAEVLGRKYRTLKNVGNLNNEIGLPLTLLRLTSGHERAVLEMGFFVPGEITMLCNLARPEIGVITNIGTVHAERAGSQEVIARGKAELVEALPPDGWAILNYDDPWVRPMAEKTRAHVFYYGLDPAADLWVDHIEGLGLEGISFRLHYKNEVIHLRVPLIGRHSVHTVLRSAAVGLVENMTWNDIIMGLQHGRTQLRMVAVYTRNGALVLDDTYNASPESTLAALNLLGEINGRHIAVLGDMLELGQYERQGHEMVGIRTAEVASELIAVGERARMIAEGARRAGLKSKSIISFATVPETIDYLQEHPFKKGEVILIKGSHGMHMERIVAAMETGK
jgi:UDP-N-acetylmuramoyl-tripeptide--D-alanyl-D-alanine ligase